MQVVLNIPDEYFLNTTIAEMTKYLKLYTALLMFQSGKLSAGAACEFAEVDRYTFLVACQQHHINVINYEEDDIEADLERLNQGKKYANCC
jgi:predicted HTH domain antitoxin